MKLKVNIEILVEPSDLVVISLVNKEENFAFTGNLVLNGLMVKSVGMIRIKDKNGNARTDCFGLQLKKKADILQFKEGQIAELINGI